MELCNLGEKGFSNIASTGFVDASGATVRSLLFAVNGGVVNYVL